ncbi:hypothetical protein M413DRAFT_12975 [Hebeloma cylindrosporum]|uniref:Uncharacterized protein n=1 Tax=Hebeloma cylindrosporum TaxID=76867 RepID=A0A0C3C2Z2_HEBCY|nr:hypothetical protein M413DRAFT_12975 [Hebeloma cylindrosporum h7]
MNNLSDDILSSMFSYLMTSTAILPPSLGDDPRLQLMAVSRRWRDVIFNSSNLWDTVIVLPRSPETSLELLMIASKWLEIRFVRDHVLSTFFLRPMYLNRQGPRNRTRTGEIFRVLEDGFLPVARGTKSLSCTLSTDHGIQSFFAIPPGTFGCLEKLNISLPSLPDQGLAHRTKTMIKDKLRTFTAFQNLRHLRSALINISNGIHPLLLRIPWSQLTSLDMRSTRLRPNVFLEVLSASALSLKEGSFTIRFKRTRSTASAPQETFRIVKARFLQYLRLRLINPSRDKRFLFHLYLTALSHLKIDLDDRAGWRMWIYHRLLSRSSSTLRSLEFMDAPPQVPRRIDAVGHDLEGLFARCPNLERLQLPIGVHMPQMTVNKIAEGSLLPYLRSLEVFSTVGIDILEMVGRRNELVYRRFGIGSSELGSGTAAYAPFFAHVVLHTLLENRSNATLARRYIRLFSSSQGTVFDFRFWVESNSRYTMIRLNSIG